MKTLTILRFFECSASEKIPDSSSILKFYQNRLNSNRDLSLMKADPLQSSSQKWMTTLFLFGDGAHDVQCSLLHKCNCAYTVRLTTTLVYMCDVKKNSSVGTLLLMCLSIFVDTNINECAFL